ncbi:proteasome regulatory particle subunit [Castilleja foliolosa]|uniref:Proteasome regulatory particle subunit n=1 Tax=Castilleja foliolosa TaxID=1961234 RepID=A0ABD3E263_9LAMI
MEGEEGVQNPQLALANMLFSLTLNDVDDIEKVRLRDEVFKFIFTNDMAPLYETLIADKFLELDQKALESMLAKNDDELKKLKENSASNVLKQG